MSKDFEILCFFIIFVYSFDTFFSAAGGGRHERKIGLVPFSPGWSQTGTKGPYPLVPVGDANRAGTKGLV
jgi:hypothetical protein